MAPVTLPGPDREPAPDPTPVGSGGRASGGAPGAAAQRRWDLDRPAILTVGGASFLAVGAAGLAGVHGMAQWLVGVAVAVGGAGLALALRSARRPTR